MRKVVPKNGIVGFFDILGYGSFLENNEAEEAATVIVNILTKLHERVPKLAGKVFSETAAEFRKPVDRVQWLVFSDTIVIVLPWSDQNVDRFRFNEWVAFLMVAELLGRMMFDYGLPLRGAVTGWGLRARRKLFRRKISDRIVSGHNLAGSRSNGSFAHGRE